MRVADIELHEKGCGDGDPPLLLIAGIPAIADDWAPFAERLAPGAAGHRLRQSRLRALDGDARPVLHARPRGRRGRTARRAGDRARRRVRDVARRHDRPGARARLAGARAAAGARLHPRRRRARRAAAARDGPGVRAADRRLGGAHARARAVRVRARRRRGDRRRVHRQEVGRRPGPGRLRRADRGGARHDSYDRLPQLGAPTLVITGDDDQVIPAASSDVLRDRIPGARLEVLAGAGHLFFLEQPERTVELLEDFLA